MKRIDVDLVVSGIKVVGTLVIHENEYEIKTQLPFLVELDRKPQEKIEFEGNKAIIPEQTKREMVKREKKLCVVPDCFRKIVAKRLCAKHYQIQRNEFLKGGE